MAKAKLRLDQLVVQKGLAPSRAKAQALIMAGNVRVGGKRAEKPGQRVSESSKVEIIAPACPYVSRGGIKLAHALDRFGIDVQGLTCMDVGASTGGFTHCLLMRKASKVFAIDVGYGQLDWNLRNDPRVVVMEKTNIRHLPAGSLDREVDLATVDTSFISLRLVIPAILPHLKERGMMVALIKPQFEAGKGKVGKGGVVRDPALHKQVIDGLVHFFTVDTGLAVNGITRSPITGPKGNEEFLIFLTKKPEIDHRRDEVSRGFTDGAVESG